MASPVELVIVGHLATNEDRTPHGRNVSVGGAAFYCAVGAGLLAPDRVGVVATVGGDFELGCLSATADVRGVRVRPGCETAHFVVTQHPDGSRSFEARWGAADIVDLNAFPACYHGARHVHLATAPPQQQMQWLKWVRRTHPAASVSADAFEQFASESPDASRDVLASCDLAFLNEEELRLLAPSNGDWQPAPHILKRGPRGAEYRRPDGEAVVIRAEPMSAADTTGAGDVLAGAFLSLRILGYPVGIALGHAVAVATASVTEFGMGPRLRATIDQLKKEVTSDRPSALSR